MTFSARRFPAWGRGVVRVACVACVIVPATTLPAPAQVASVVRLLSDPNPSVRRQYVAFTAGVNWSAAASPTGTITLTDTVTCPGAASATSAVLATIPLGSSSSPSPGSGEALFSSFPCSGEHSIVASYSGDSNYAPVS